MKEIIFMVDEATGQLTMRINGVPGKACAPIAKMVEDLLGIAATHDNTTEWYAETHDVVKARKA